MLSLLFYLGIGGAWAHAEVAQDANTSSWMYLGVTLLWPLFLFWGIGISLFLILTKNDR